MTRKLTLIGLLILNITWAQTLPTDTLQKVATVKTDTLKVMTKDSANVVPNPVVVTKKTVIEEPFVEDSTAYRIKPNDKLRIRNLLSLNIIYPDATTSIADLKGGGGNAAGEKPFEIFVDKRGMITLPRIGRLKVGGLTRLQAVEAIEKAYGNNILTDPIFEIEIVNLRIQVLGAVVRQGMIALEGEKLTLGEVLAMSGGIDFSNADKMIRLIRKKDSQQIEIDYNIRDLSNPGLTNIPIYDGDYVFVPLSKGSLRNVKYQRVSNILQPIALTLNAVAVLLALWLSNKKP